MVKFTVFLLAWNEHTNLCEDPGALPPAPLLQRVRSLAAGRFTLGWRSLYLCGVWKQQLQYLTVAMSQTISVSRFKWCVHPSIRLVPPPPSLLDWKFNTLLESRMYCSWDIMPFNRFYWSASVQHTDYCSYASLTAQSSVVEDGWLWAERFHSGPYNCLARPSHYRGEPFRWLHCVGKNSLNSVIVI